MKSAVAAVFALVVLAGAVPAQDETPGGVDPEFVSAMGRNSMIARWLAGYDLAAWYSADEFMKEPPEVVGRVRSWFCYPADDGWHAIYGVLDKEAGKYERLHHYLVVSPKEIKKVEDLTSGEDDVALVRAYHDAMPRLMAKPEARRCRFNPYIRKTEAGVEVWAHPGVAGDWTIVYGVAFCWTYSADGTEFKSEKTHGKKLHGIRGQKETPVVIGETESPVPAVSEMYVVERFRYLFEEIGVRSKTGVSFLMPTGMWTHVVRDGAAAVEPAEEERPVEDESEPAEPEPDEPQPDEPRSDEPD